MTQPDLWPTKERLLDEYNSLMRGGKIKPITMTPISSYSLRGRVCPDVRTDRLVLLHLLKLVGNLLPGPEQQPGKELEFPSVFLPPGWCLTRGWPLHLRLSESSSVKRAPWMPLSPKPREWYTFVEMDCLSGFFGLCISHPGLHMHWSWSVSFRISGAVPRKRLWECKQATRKRTLPSPSSHAGKMYPLVALGWAREWDAMEQGSPQLEIETILSLQIKPALWGRRLGWSCSFLPEVVEIKGKLWCLSFLRSLQSFHWLLP